MYDLERLESCRIGIPFPTLVSSDKLSMIEARKKKKNKKNRKKRNSFEMTRAFCVHFAIVANEELNIVVHLNVRMI